MAKIQQAISINICIPDKSVNFSISLRLSSFKAFIKSSNPPSFPPAACPTISMAITNSTPIITYVKNVFIIKLTPFMLYCVVCLNGQQATNIGITAHTMPN